MDWDTLSRLDRWSFIEIDGADEGPPCDSDCAGLCREAADTEGRGKSEVLGGLTIVIPCELSTISTNA